MNDEKQIRDYLLTEADELKKLANSLDADALSKAKQMILESEAAGGRVHITGIGKPSHIAGYGASLLSSTGTPCYVLDATEAYHGSLGQVAKGDVVIAISNSGQTEELTRTVQALLNNGAKVIGISRSPDSWLSQHADLALVCKVDQEGDSLNKPPRLSILAQTLILQLISLLLQNEKGLTLEQYGRFHPGGALGKAVRKELHETV